MANLKRKLMQLSLVLGFTLLTNTMVFAEDNTVQKITLDQAVELALENNLQYKLAIGEVNIAKDKVAQADSGYKTKLKLSAGATHLSEVPDIVKLGRNLADLNNALDGTADLLNSEYANLAKLYGMFADGNPLNPNTQLNQLYQQLAAKSSYLAGRLSQKQGPDDGLNYYGIKLNLEKPLYTGNKIESLGKQAKANADQASASMLVARSNTVFEVKKAYYTVVQAQRMVETATQAVGSMEGHLKEAQSYFKAGMVPQLDVIRAEVKLSDLKQKLLMAQNGLAIAKTAFNFVLGVDLANDYQLVDELQYSPLQQDLNSCEEIALSNRPEMAQVKAKIEMAKQAVEIARSANKPMVALQGEYEQKDTKPFYGKPDWSISLVGSINLIDGGLVKNQIAEAEDVLKQANTGKELVQRVISLEVKQAYLNLQNAYESIQVAQKSLDQAKETVRMAEVSYKAGLSTSLERIDAEVGLTQAKNNYDQALSQYSIALAQLGKAMGIEKEAVNK